MYCEKINVSFALFLGIVLAYFYTILYDMKMGKASLIRSWMHWKEQKERIEVYSQKAMSIDSGVRETYISSIMKGKRNPNEITLTKIAQGAFGVSYIQFLAGPPAQSGESSQTTGTEEEEGMPDVRLRGELMTVLCRLSTDDLRTILSTAQFLQARADEKREKNRGAV